jgi:anti-sigma factor RsiW
VTADELTCQMLVEVITDYIEGTMPPAEREQFEAHLAICPGCVTYLTQMRQTIEVVGRLRADELDRNVQAELVSLFREWKNGG